MEMITEFLRRLLKEESLPETAVEKIAAEIARCDDGRASTEKCPECGQPITYQGWSTYETWYMHCVLTDDQGTLDRWLARARYHLDAGQLAAEMADTLERQQPELAPIWQTLLGSAFSEIDWYEIAASFVEAAENTHA